MCFDIDSSPPIPVVKGAAVNHADLTLEASDGNRFAAFLARAEERSDTSGIVVLPDVRGLYHFYEELALRFAEQGHDSVAIDYFGRTAGISKRGDEFPYMDHVRQTTAAGVKSDAAAAVAYLRDDDPDRKIFTIGFCFGGSSSWHQAANGLGLTGAIGFYGNPNAAPEGSVPIIERTNEIACPILGLMGGEDPSIPTDVVNAYRAALDNSGVTNEIVVYEGAPHSFFDRKYDEFADDSADAWARVLAFLELHS